MPFPFGEFSFARFLPAEPAIAAFVDQRERDRVDVIGREMRS
jgi:hypothetical protein